MAREMTTYFVPLFFVSILAFGIGSVFDGEFSWAQRTDDLVFAETKAYRGDEGKNFYVKGRVRNATENTTVRNVKITVRVYDKENNLLVEKTVDSNPERILPGKEAVFEVVVPYDEKMYQYKKTATWKVRR